MSIITAKNITKSFNTIRNTNLLVLKNVTLSLPKNKISVIFGASGAGKSTLLHILSGLDKPDSGEVLINDMSIFKMNDEKIAKFRNKNIGFVFQFHHLLAEFTALENVIIPQIVFNSNFNKAKIRAKELLSEMGLSDRLNHKPAELSGGEQQRIALARALANDPQLIFADEPTGNLDTANSEIINDIFIKLRDNYHKSLLIVTHNKELMKIADNLIEMKDGEILNLLNQESLSEI